MGETRSKLKALGEYSSVQVKKMGLVFVKFPDKSGASAPFAQPVTGNYIRTFTSVFNLSRL